MSRYELNTKPRLSRAEIIVIMLAMIALSIIAITWILRNPPGKEVEEKKQQTEFAVQPPASVINIRTVCYEGILYFTDLQGSINNSAVINAAVIDRDSKQPKVCNVQNSSNHPR